MLKERIDAETALKLFLPHVKPVTRCEEVPLSGAINRVLTRDIIASRDIPPFDRAAMDGYAVRAEDTFGASPENPILLDIVGEIEIGEKPGVEVQKGQAVRIATGAMMPEGSNAVVMIEYTNRVGDSVEIYKAVTPGENVSLRGEDVKAGEVVLRKKTVLQPQDIGMLAALGMKSVEVYKPVVAVMSTGNELVEPGDGDEEAGKTIDSNRYALIAALKELGCEVVDMGISRDNEEELERTIKTALNKADMVIASGATSVGKKDLLPAVVEKLGKVVVHGVAIKPGMPTALAIADGKPVIMLPGFPVATLIAFYTFVPRILEHMMGFETIRRKWEKARAITAKRIPSSSGMRTFTRVILRESKDGYIAEPVRTSGSGILSSLVRAHGFVIIPEEKEGVEEGEEVEVLLIRPLTRCLNAQNI
ncbi:molybdopterin molybdotransferase MoeA [Archaeoglobus veneficus]|uniref:molybdopterin molybdotransferase n=1 Tax=Archaeoglobus veneficus (strain DSM 11195 / SNP6) TaxID=693661 RepID=F2KNQ2_ARCVS|nr:gephyrin-like molybdotransferase Glp [Archaeoglobus veneficus]AEA46280.1 molybdenum cofactor synthesis domain protein [Archaeoglobus veneficus SNP6]